MWESRFWRMCEPNYDSDYDSMFVNGLLEHPFGLPGVYCDACGETWASTRVLPVPCPEALRDIRELNERWPISADQHRQLRDEVRAAILAEGHDCPELAPGDCFQPSFLDVPSTPSFDFLWASLGSVVISKRMRPLFEPLGSHAVSIFPVNCRKIGAALPDLPAPVPSTGEPFDLLAEADLRSTDLPSYFELVVSTESGTPHGIEFLAPCPKCGRVDYKGPRQLAMFDDMSPDTDVFQLATTLWIVVTSSFKAELEDARPTNVRFEAVSGRDAV